MVVPRRLLFVSALTALLALVFSFASLSTQDADAVLDTEEANFLTIINNYRAQNGLGPLVEDAGMQEAAEWLANDMATKDYMSHTDSLNRDMTTRLKAIISPFPYTAWGENVAAGYSSGQSVFVGWKNSAPHNKNMLNGSYNVIGISMVCKTTNTYGCYWATDFGQKPGLVTPPPGTPTPANSPTPIPTPSPTPSPSATPTPTPLVTNTPGPTGTPSPTNTPSPTPVPNNAPAVPTNGESILTQPMTVGQKTLQIASAENLGLKAGDVIIINPGTATEEVHTIQGTGPLRLANGVAFPHDGGQIIVKVFSGDVDCDGDVDAADTGLILRIRGGLSVAGKCVDVADVNCDNLVKGNDAVLTLRRAALNDDLQPAPNCPQVGGPHTANSSLSQGSAPASATGILPASAANVIYVDSIEGFEVGDTIRINPGGENEEENVIVTIGSGFFILQSDLLFAHGSGEEVERVIWTPRNQQPDPDATPTPIATPTPTEGEETPAPTDTPTLTPTETDGEGTPTPTDTPTPVPTDTPSPTPGEG